MRCWWPADQRNATNSLSQIPVVAREGKLAIPSALLTMGEEEMLPVSWQIRGIILPANICVL